MNSETDISFQPPTKDFSVHSSPERISTTMRQSSPQGGVVLPPPLPHSQSQSPRDSLTLPPLSTLSPLMRSPSNSKPQPTSTSLSNLVHHEKRGEPSNPYRRDSQLSPRARARTQSMEASRPGLPFETIDEHPVHYDGQVQAQYQGQRRPRRSMPATAERPYP